jgi:uncharacterized protein YhaN
MLYIICKNPGSLKAFGGIFFRAKEQNMLNNGEIKALKEENNKLKEKIKNYTTLEEELTTRRVFYQGKKLFIQPLEL